MYAQNPVFRIRIVFLKTRFKMMLDQAAYARIFLAKP